MQNPDWQKLMLTMIGLVLALIALISLLLAWRYKPPAADAAALLFQRFARKTRLEPGTGETSARFAQRAIQSGRLPAAAVESVTSAYHDARYGPGDDTAIARLKRAVDAIR